LKVLGIAGSLRSGSHNRELLRLAASSAPLGIELVEWDRLREVPPYDTDVENVDPEPVADLRRAIADADAVLIATPEYNGTIPGQLKNALDWVSRPDVHTGPFRGKPAAVVSASTGMFGAMWASADLKKVLGLMGARVVDNELALAKAHERLTNPDEEIHASLRDTFELLAAEVAENARLTAAA
jgi:chromate reductase